MTETVEDKNFRSQRHKITLKFKKEDQEIKYQKEEYTRKCSNYKWMLIIIYIGVPIWLIYDIIKYNSIKNDNKVAEKEKKVTQFFLLFESLFLAFALFEYLLIKYIPKNENMPVFIYYCQHISISLLHHYILYPRSCNEIYDSVYLYLYIYIYILIDLWLSC